MAQREHPWHGATVRIAGLFVAFGVVACGVEKAPDAALTAGDAGVTDASDNEGPIPPAPTEPGCAMTVDGEPLPPEAGWAKLTDVSRQPALRVSCSGVEIEIRRPGGPGEYEAFASYGWVPRPEYRGACTTRLDRLAIKERGGLALRVRCDVPLMRDLRGTARTQRVHIEGYVVLPPAGPLPAFANLPIGDGGCRFSVKGEYSFEGSGSGSSLACVGGPFVLASAGSYASITGTFCPTCTTYYNGHCATTNAVERDHTVSYDVDCELEHELSGELRVSAHVENGAILLAP